MDVAAEGRQRSRLDDSEAGARRSASAPERSVAILPALQEAGFPVYDHAGDGSKFWRVESKSLGALARSGLTFSELCALYFSRALIECFAGTHVLADVQSALAKFESALTPQMKKFIDRLPGVVTAKPAGAKRQARQHASGHRHAARGHPSRAHRHDAVSLVVERTRRRNTSSIPIAWRTCRADCTLVAYVPAYGELRTFAVERVRRATGSQKSFTPLTAFESDPFKHSLGAYRGAKSKVQLQFHPQIAAYIKERSWHSSQRLKDRADGSVTMTMEVSDDYALRSWILSFGRLVRVASPASLAEWVLGELDGAREQYASGEFSRIVDVDRQPPLPFALERLGEG